ncbi:MAG: outer membrane protein assembly factor BamD [Candidatus Latescibacteria bacterium]|nr:outer membrane protein assembly factor BamD [Candidatus Latescibacterota bacterium]
MVSGFTGIGKNFIIILLVIFSAGCSSMRNKPVEEMDAQHYFNHGIEMMGKKDYLKAIEDFETVVNSFASSAIVDHAQLMLAEANFMSEEYLTAAYEYERVYMDYPSSEFAPEAHYKKALCYYNLSPTATLDQENTQLAIDEFNRFIDDYPSHQFISEAQERIEELVSKLAYKDYLNAELYKKSKHLENNLDAALFYYRYVIDKYPRAIWADYARFGIGEVNFMREEYEKAKEVFLLLVNKNTDMELNKKASKMLNRIENLQKK